MKKLYLLLGSLCAALIIFIVVQLQQPNAEEIERYQAILCFVLRQPHPPQTAPQLQSMMHLVQEGSISDYAFNHPDFREELAQQWIETYLALPKAQQMQTHLSYEQCIAVMPHRL